MNGLDDLQRALGALDAFVVGALRREVTERRTARSTGTDVSAWQAAHGPYLTRMLDTGRYPTVARLVVDGAHLGAEETFRHNLATVLDGVTNRPARPRTPPGTSRSPAGGQVPARRDGGGAARP